MNEMEPKKKKRRLNSEFNSKVNGLNEEKGNIGTAEGTSGGSFQRILTFEDFNYNTHYCNVGGYIPVESCIDSDWESDWNDDYD